MDTELLRFSGQKGEWFVVEQFRDYFWKLSCSSSLNMDLSK